MATKPFSSLNPAILLPRNEYCSTDSGLHRKEMWGCWWRGLMGHPVSHYLQSPPLLQGCAADVSLGMHQPMLPGPWRCLWLPVHPAPPCWKGLVPLLRSRAFSCHREDENFTASRQAACMRKKVHIVRGPYKIVG